MPGLVLGVFSSSADYFGSASLVLYEASKREVKARDVQQLWRKPDVRGTASLCLCLCWLWMMYDSTFTPCCFQ